ncbi:GNAT family N-acetyltransferase, partial [Gammaproteobacteria bacterium]|nr:GNAT family N-acetyltransferase [Gammaproteobacteria bacterium]
MFSIETVLQSQYTPRGPFSRLRNRLLGAVLKRVMHQDEFQRFASHHPNVRGVAFAEAVLDHLNFRFQVRDDERENIPASGRVIIVSNHPLGSLESLSLVKLVGSIRSDLRIVANAVLTELEPLQSIILPVDNMGGQTGRDQLRAMETHLNHDGA